METQLAASVTVTAYDPESTPEISSVIEVLDQIKLYAPAGETVRSIAPLGNRHWVLGATSAESMMFVFCAVIVKESNAVHPLEAVTVTVYSPTGRPEISSVVNPVDQRKVLPVVGTMDRSIAPF